MSGYSRLRFVLGVVAVAFWGAACSVPEKGVFKQPTIRASEVKNSFTVAPARAASLAGNRSGDSEIVRQLKVGIEAQRSAGYPNYNPAIAYVVDPSKQQMQVYNLDSWTPVLAIPVGTGKRGLGFGGAQTPIGFFTMGGVRIAKNSNAYIQTGDSKTGVSGVYAEILYPPSHGTARLRGKVPNNVIIHGFNPRASQMLRERHTRKMIGRIPCTTGCPVPAMKDLPKLSPYLKQSAGSFDPSARPNSNLRRLIQQRQVVEYSTKNRLGDPILILNRPFRG